MKGGGQDAASLLFRLMPPRLFLVSSFYSSVLLFSGPLFSCSTLHTLSRFYLACKSAICSPSGLLFCLRVCPPFLSVKSSC